MTASALKHDQDIIIIKSTKGVKLFWYEEVAEVRWAKKCAIILFMEKAANALTLCQSLTFISNVSLWEFNCIKIQAMSLILNLF